MSSTTTPPQAVDPDRMEALLHHFVEDLGAAFSYPLILTGERLGLFSAMADGAPLDAATLAQRTGTTERYVIEWLSAMAASGYVTYDGDGRFHLAPEQAVVLTRDDGPAYVPGAFHVAAALLRDEPRLAEAFRSGDGVAWGEHDEALFHGTERFFRPGYAMNLTTAWIPALDGVQARLETGARVADIGCGHGASTVLMAGAYPNSSFVGSDVHEPSIEAARDAAASAGVGDRVTFEVAGAQEFSGSDYDLVCVFDALHDMGNPVGVARHVREALSPDGCWMIVEPMAGDRLEDNLNPVGRAFYAASTAFCVPNALSQDGGMALGAQAGDTRLRGVLADAGFSSVRRATETPLNRVFEARP